MGGAATTFFGEDLQPNPNALVALTNHPNASAAQASFLSNLTGMTTQEFEGLAVGTVAPITVAFGPDTATISGSSAVIRQNSASGLGVGRFAISGTRYLETNTTSTITFQLAPVGVRVLRG